MKQQREKQKREADFLRQAEQAEEERKIQELKAKEEARGCSWGIGMNMQEFKVNLLSLPISSFPFYFQLLIIVWSAHFF